MADDNYIIDQPVPVNQDFKALKELGLEFIRDHSGNEWTNLNASDPGVTILEQLCYALTELGYCNDFSVGDILAEPSARFETTEIDALLICITNPNFSSLGNVSVILYINFTSFLASTQVSNFSKEYIC